MRSPANFLPTLRDAKHPKRVGKIQALEEIYNVLGLIYDEMLEAYRGDKPREQAAYALIEVYNRYALHIDQITRKIEEIRDLYRVTVEALNALREKEAITVSGGRIRGGCLVAKLVTCGKKCRGCPHGPYLYRVVKSGGKQVWKYLGKVK